MGRYSEAGDPGGEEGCSAKEGGRMIVQYIVPLQQHIKSQKVQLSLYCM